MITPENVNNAVLKQSNEHKIILDYVVRFDQALMTKNMAELLALIRAIAPFLQKDLRTHFEMEEKYYFPAVLLNSPDEEMVNLILQLQHDHGMLTRDLHWMTEYIEQAKSQHANVDRELLNFIRPFLHALKGHSKLEIVKLFPYIDGTPQVQEWLIDKMTVDTI